MPTLLRGAQLVEFEPPSAERADLRIADGLITARAQSLEPQPDDEVVELDRRIVMPGLVSAHHHLHGSIMRGFPKKGYSEHRQMLALVEAAIDADAAWACARYGALEGLRNGTTSVVALHGLRGQHGGCLPRIAEGLEEVGVRAALALEISEHTPEVEKALEELRAFIDKPVPRVAPALGLTGLDVMTQPALEQAIAQAKASALPVTVSLSEDPAEERRCQETFGLTPLERLSAVIDLGPSLVISQAVHCSWPELSQLLASGCWLSHCARSNMMTQSGLATAAKFGIRASFGTDVLSLDVMAEAQTAWMRSRDSHAPIDMLRFLGAGHRLASQLFGATIGPLREGAVADLVVLDYAPTTPLLAETIADHLALGMSPAHIESVMVDGIWRSWKRKYLGPDAGEIAETARVGTATVWRRLSSPG